jgi:hypothetical protein
VSTLIDLAIQQVLFFANALDDDVQPDVAIGQLELLVSELNALDPDDLAAVSARVRERLADASGPEREALIELESMLA